METYSSNTSDSSSGYFLQYPEEAKDLKPTQSFNSSLRSVRKPQVKPWKKPIAPLPPMPPRLYKVDPVNFRELVQKLTGANADEYCSGLQRLHSVAPPPLDLASTTTAALFGKGLSAMPPGAAATPLQPPNPSSVKVWSAAFHQDLVNNETVLDAKYNKISDGTVMVSSSLVLNPSPSAYNYNWCSFPLLSPGTLASLEQSTVL